MIGKITRITALLIVVFLSGMLTMNIITRNSEPASTDLQSKFPMRPTYSAKVILQEGSRQAFLAAVRDYAKETGFAIKIDYDSPDRTSLNIEMWSINIWIVMTSDIDPNVVKVFFYEHGYVPVTDEYLVNFIEMLKERLLALEGATYVET